MPNTLEHGRLLINTRFLLSFSSNTQTSAHIYVSTDTPRFTYIQIHPDKYTHTYTHTFLSSRLSEDFSEGAAVRKLSPPFCLQSQPVHLITVVSVLSFTGFVFQV